MSDSDSWQTPDWLFQELNNEFHFDIDLCATDENSKCKFHCDDYLSFDIHRQLQDYSGSRNIKTAFMNPPYSNPRPFIEKAWEDSKHCKIVCLVKCDPSTKWWATFWEYGTEDCPVCNDDVREEVNKFCCKGRLFYRGPKPGCEVRFFPKRIKFDPPSGFEGKTSGPSFPSALIIMDRREIE